MIIDTHGNDHPNHFEVRGSGIVEIISAETLHLPHNITGFAHVKTSLVDGGLLPLNIGIIDPGWNAKISATLVNFGDGEGKIIQKGDRFLRLTFIEHQAGTIKKPDAVCDDEYIRSRRRKVTQNFGETFLGWDKFKFAFTKVIESKLDESEKRVLPTRVGIMVAIFALLLTGAQFLGSYIIAAEPFHWMGSRWDNVPSKSDVKTAKDSAKAALTATNRHEQDIRMLRNEVDALLQKDIASRTPKAATRINRLNH